MAFLKLVISVVCALLVSVAMGQDPIGKFSGPVLVTEYDATDGPIKKKKTAVLTIKAAGQCDFGIAGSSTDAGNWFIENGYLFVSVPKGPLHTSGRLVIKGNKVISGYSGTLSLQYNGFSGLHDFKMNLKRQ